MKKFIVVILIILVVLIPFSACQKTDDNQLVVGMELAYPPFEMTNEKDIPDGFSVKLAEAIGEQLKRPVRIESMAWSGLIPALTTGKIDMVLSSMTITKERAKTVNFSNPYAKSQLSLLINKDSKVMTFNDLKKDGAKLAVKKGTTGHIYATEHLDESHIVVFEKAETAVLEVSQGKADAFIYDALTIYNNSQQYKDTTRASFEIFQEDFEYWGIALNKKDTQLLKDVNSALKTLQDNGTVNEIANTYLGDVKKVFDDNQLSFFFDIN